MIAVNLFLVKSVIYRMFPLKDPHFVRYKSMAVRGTDLFMFLFGMRF